MKCKTQIIIFIAMMTLSSILPTKIAYSAASFDINATIKVSVCGNNVAEGGEECDTADIRGKTCQDFGLSTGTVTCDIGCGFDTSGCAATTPTPSPTITSTPTPTPPLSVTPTPTASPVIHPTTVPTPTDAPIIPTAVPTQPQLPPPFSTLLAPAQSFPATLLYFGANKEGRIAVTQLHSSVQEWVTQWQNSLASVTVKNTKIAKQQANVRCDINGDKVCDLADLSIMLYYVQP